MYSVTLAIHNLARWIVLLLAAWALFRAYSGWLGGRAWTAADRRAGLFFSIALDVQFLLGLLLTFASPLMRAALDNLQAAMAVDALRFVVVEHIPLMIVALVVAHVAGVAARRAPEDTRKHRRAAIGISLAVLLTLVAIPWSRPLLRGLG